MSAQVPKFSSFKPKKELGKEDLGDSDKSKVSESKPRASTEDTENDKSSKRKRDHHFREDFHKRHRHHRDRSHSREKDDGKQIGLRDKVNTTDHLLPDLFFIDTKGDEKNLVYGNIHRYSVPSFRRYGNGSVLGCPKYLKIDRNLSDDRGIVLMDCRKTHSSKREKYNFAKVEKGQTKLLAIRPQAQSQIGIEIDADFVSFESSNRKKRKRADIDDEFLSEDDHQHYRSIEGKAKDGPNPLDQDLRYVTDESSSDLEGGREMNLDSDIKTRNVELSRNVEKHPQNFDAWIELINHQDQLLGIGENGPRKVTQAERKSTAEIKIHMYEKALRRVDSSSTRSLERLSIGLMNEGAKAWDVKTQSSRWEEMTKEYPYSITLWKKFVDFRQTNFSTFGYEEHRKLFSTRMSLLRKLAVENNRSKSELYDLHQSIMYTLIRATFFIRDSGFRELSLAIWQGILEYNLFSPSPSNTSISKMTELFGDFWESEVPRIGEGGALGWCSYDRDPTASAVPVPHSDPKIPELTLLKDKKVLFEKWATAEVQQSKHSREPARTMDDVTENDPYRLVLFSDIEPFLILLPIEGNPNLGMLLFSAFLAFCQLPQEPISGSYASSKAWKEDSFIRTELLNCDEYILQQQLEALESDKDDASRVFSKYAFQNFITSSETNFATINWFQTFKPWTFVYNNDSAPINYQWVRNALRLLSTKTSQFAECYISFEFANEPQAIKKSAKSLLKQYPTSLDLYNAYAMIEWNRGNKDVAKNVFSSALGMAGSFSNDERGKIFLLRKSFVWALLEEGNSREAFQQLLSVSEVSPAAILKMKHELLGARDHSVSSGQLSMAVIQTELLAILEYYTTSLGARIQGDIVSAIPVFLKFSELLSDRGLRESSDSELLFQSSARLLYLHAKSGPYRLAFLREHLTHAISLFPQNTILLSIFAWNERRMTRDRKVQSTLLNTCLTPGTVITHIFAIRHEILHGNVNSQQAAFETAVSGDSETKHNPGLWKLYVMWCLQKKKYENKARDVFYRGVAACPWAKGFMMLAFTELSKWMRDEDMKGVYKVLVEKELRVHVDIDEELEG